MERSDWPTMKPFTKLQLRTEHVGGGLLTQSGKCCQTVTCSFILKIVSSDNMKQTWNEAQCKMIVCHDQMCLKMCLCKDTTKKDFRKQKCQQQVFLSNCLSIATNFLVKVTICLTESLLHQVIEVCICCSATEDWDNKSLLIPFKLAILTCLMPFEG